jgi:hypothetical protein
MQRHIVDKPKSYNSAIRLREFLRIARNARPHWASLTLQRRAKERPGLVQFIRIAREQQR